MKDASTALYKGLRTLLLADAGVLAILGASPAKKVITDWSVFPDAPFIRIHIPQVRDFEADCGEGSEHTIHVHCWAAGQGAAVVASNLAAAIRQALDEARPVLEDADLWWLDYVATIKRQDPSDPILHTARVEFSAVTSDA